MESDAAWWVKGTTFYKVCFLPLPFSFLLVGLWWGRGGGIDRWDETGSVLCAQVEGELSYRVAIPVHAIPWWLFV